MCCMCLAEWDLFKGKTDPPMSRSVNAGQKWGKSMDRLHHEHSWDCGGGRALRNKHVLSVSPIPLRTHTHGAWLDVRSLTDRRGSSKRESTVASPTTQILTNSPTSLRFGG